MPVLAFVKLTFDSSSLGMGDCTMQASVTTATHWLTTNLMAKLRRSIIKARVAGKRLDLKKEIFTLSGSSFLQGVDWQFIQDFLERALLD